MRGHGRSLQAATITAHKPGYFEENLNRQGDCLAASGPPSEQEIKAWSGRKDRVFVPDRPLELNFVMRRRAGSRGGWSTSRGSRWMGTRWHSTAPIFHRHRA